MSRKIWATAILAAGIAPLAGARSLDARTFASTAAFRSVGDNGEAFGGAEETDDLAARESELYERGTRAMDEGDWTAAARAFQEVVQMSGARGDGARYWVAYALAKQGRRDEALAALRGFESKYPKSSWRKDVRALELEIRPASGKTLLREGGDDEDLKLMAINGLMSSEPEQAVPMLEKVLNGNASPRVKERALFVLAQSGSPRARQIIASVARGADRPELQEKAIHYLGISGGKGNAELLSEIYASSKSVELKEKVLHAFMLSGDKARVVEAARDEKSPELRAAAVRLLGVMGARTELWQMYGSEATGSVKDTILQALFIAGDVDHVAELARTESDANLRREAIHRLGIMGNTEGVLLRLYREEKDVDARKAVLQALFLQNSAKSLVEIARSEKDPRLKAEAVSKLAIMHDKDATNYMLEILNH